MTASVHAYTSITSNYLPKARVLAASVKRVDPSVQFHLMLCDDPPVGFDLEKEPFDSVITAESLPIENLSGWLFSHTVVELCTAVKGIALEVIFENKGADKVFYFDPDMVVFSRLDELAAELDSHSILLTPHQTDPETSDDAIMDNEMASLTYGVFNLGFVGVRNDHEGRRFSRWWADRLLSYCHDDLPRGLFTDQKWVNLAPCFFDNVRVLRSPAFNVATWNITNRRATGSIEEGVQINGEPLGFYHFSGFDSGAQEVMLNKYGKDSPVLFQLRDWYIAACEEQGQSLLGELPYKYGAYDDGTPISRPQRLLYRQRLDLRQAFPNPFATGIAGGGYKAWYAANADEASHAYKVVSISPQAGFSDVLADLSVYFRDTAHAGKAGPLARLSLKVAAACLALAVRIVRMTR